MRPLPLSSPAAYAAFAIRRRLHEYVWRVRSVLRKTSVQIAGEYFAGNLGDWTMGQAFLNVSRQAGIASGLISYSASSGASHRVIMGGGEIGDVYHFERAIRIAGAPERVVACGINPVHTFDRFPEELLAQIYRMPYLSVRSAQGAEIMRAVLGRSDVEFNPDPAFSFAPFAPPRANVPKRMAVSLLTFYLNVQNRNVFAADQTMKSVVADPEFTAQIDQAGERYIEMMKSLIRQALEDGWEVINIPFSEVDALFADTIFQDLNVKRQPYVRKPVRVLQTLRSCRRFVVARFHAHIFGLMAQIPVVSIAYSGKCTQLWNDLGLDSARQISRMDICHDPQECAARLLADEGTQLPAEQLRTLAQAAQQSIINAFEAVES